MTLISFFNFVLGNKDITDTFEFAFITLNYAVNNDDDTNNNNNNNNSNNMHVFSFITLTQFNNLPQKWTKNSKHRVYSDNLYSTKFARTSHSIFQYISNIFQLVSPNFRLPSRFSLFERRYLMIFLLNNKG